MARTLNRLLIECGAAETRAALVRDGAPTHFWFGPARGDECLPRTPDHGELFRGCVRTVSKSLSGAFIDIGLERDGFLPLKPAEVAPVEGMIDLFVVRRPPIGDKGAVLGRDWRRELKSTVVAAIENAPAKIGRAHDQDAAAQALAGLAGSAGGGISQIVINDAAAASALAGVAEIRIAEHPFDGVDIDEATEQSLAPVAWLPGGARLHFQETQGGVVIDVDTGGAGEGAGARLNDKTNAAAASRIMLELSRRGLGGRIIVDFLPPTSAAARKALETSLQEGLVGFAGSRFGRIARDGLADFTLPRKTLSLLERASETGSGGIRAGRRLTLDWSAKAAIRALERALASNRSGRPRLVAGVEIAAYLSDDRPQWCERLAEKFGARSAIETAAEGRDAAGARRFAIIE